MIATYNLDREQCIMTLNNIDSSKSPPAIPDSNDNGRHVDIATCIRRDLMILTCRYTM